MITEGEVKALRSVADSFSWIARQCRPDEAGTASTLQGSVSRAVVKILSDANRAVNRLWRLTRSCSVGHTGVGFYFTRRVRRIGWPLQRTGCSGGPLLANDTRQTSSSLGVEATRATLVFMLFCPSCLVCTCFLVAVVKLFAKRVGRTTQYVITSWFRLDTNMMEVHAAEASFVHGPLLASTVVRGSADRVMSKAHGSVSRVTMGDGRRMFYGASYFERSDVGNLPAWHSDDVGLSSQMSRVAGQKFCSRIADCRFSVSVTFLATCFRARSPLYHVAASRKEWTVMVELSNATFVA